MTYEEAMAFIHCTDWKGSSLGLERMRDLMFRLGNPQDTLKFVHVAGTNGKGSACTLLSRILTEAGYKTGLYTSPHLLRVNERMRINGVDIPDAALCSAAEIVKQAVNGMDDLPTEFEIITAMAFWYFAQQACDVVVLETGLGGRLDATNVISVPEVAVIMNIGLEHTEVLGDTLEKIAQEKAGIIKPGGDAITYPVNSEVDAVYARVCAEQGAHWHRARFERLQEKAVSLDGQCFDWGEWLDLRLHLLGKHQLRNAVMALETALLLREKGWDISEAALRAGLENARWEARFEVLSHDPLFIVDGAHNPQCIDALCDTLETMLPGQEIVFLTGMLADKDYRQMTARLAPFAKEFICLTPDSPRALQAEELADVLRQEGGEAICAESPEAAIALALEKSGGAPIVACGSLYMMGDIRSNFRQIWKKFLRRRCIAARKALSPEKRAAYDAVICIRIAENALWKNAKNVLSYIAVRGEPSLTGLEKLAKEQGKILCYPFCINDHEMIALHPAGNDAWRKGMFDIPEPIPERSETIAPEDIDLVLCPGTAFDEQRHRMGMGAGYYDRFLPKCSNASAVAVVYEIQKLDELPYEPWDVPMLAVFTEHRTLS